MKLVEHTYFDGTNMGAPRLELFLDLFDEELLCSIVVLVFLNVDGFVFQRFLYVLELRLDTVFEMVSHAAVPSFAINSI